MERIEEIEAAIDGLPAEEFRKIARWFRGRDQSLWDEQLDDDSVMGRLDFLFDEVESEGEEGSLRGWPDGH